MPTRAARRTTGKGASPGDVTEFPGAEVHLPLGGPRRTLLSFLEVAGKTCRLAAETNSGRKMAFLRGIMAQNMRKERGNRERRLLRPG